MKQVYLFLCFMTISISNSHSQIDVQGHRGCRGLFPENSIPAFQKALDLGVTTLELDLVISKDEKVVVSHDPFMNHEIALDINGKTISEAEEKSFNLYKMTYDSIKKYDCGSKPHPKFPEQQKIKTYKPLLEEVIDLAENHSKQTILYNIEIKSLPAWDLVYTPKVEEFVALVLDIIKVKGIENRVTLQSFDIRTLEEVKIKAPSMVISLLVDEFESITFKLKSLSFKPEIISPYYKLITKKRVKRLHKKELKVIPWTLNDEKDIKAMIDFKVDGIISDYPDRLIKILNDRKF